MRIFIYDEYEKLLKMLSEKEGTTPTKYLNTLIKNQETDCHKETAEVTNDKHERDVNR